jgi:superkiller protein 3
MRRRAAFAAAAAVALVAALAVPATASPGAEDVRESLRKGNRPKAFEQARALVTAEPADVEVHLLYQDAARGQMPVAVLAGEYRTRYEQKPGADSAYLYSRLLPPAEAEKLIHDLVKADPKSYWGQVGLAAASARLGKAAPAEQAALAALELKPGDVRAAARSGDLCATAHRWASAEACFRRALEGGGSGVNTRLGLVHALLRQGKIDDAEAALKDLRTPAKPDARVILMDAALAAERGDSPAAEKALVQATTLDPDDLDAAVQLSLLRMKKVEATPRPPGKAVDRRQVGAEMATLEKAVAALPDRADVRYALGYGREITGDADGAMADYREASRLDPLDASVLQATGALLVAKGQLEEAAAEFQRARDRDPEDAGILFQLGCVLDQQGKSKESIPLYKQIVKLEPENSRAWHLLGVALDSTGKPLEAVAAFQKAVELDPRTPRHYRELGEALFESKAYEKAQDALQKATEVDPKDAAAWTALARTRSQMKKYADAVAAYEKAAELRPKDKDIHLLLGAYYHEYLKDYEKAITHYNKYVQLGGDTADVEDWLQEAQDELDRKKKP